MNPVPDDQATATSPAAGSHERTAISDKAASTRHSQAYDGLRSLRATPAPPSRRRATTSDPPAAR